MSNAFQFYQAALDPMCCVVSGLLYEFNSTTVEYITGVGLVTRGLVYGLADYWQYADNAQLITWTLVN